MSELIDILRWIPGCAAIALGSFIALGNWVTLVGIIVTKGSSSFVPFIGGVLAAIGMLLLPVSGLWVWSWIPLIADFGTLPMWIWCLCSNRLDKAIIPEEKETEQAAPRNR